ncbi:hypothetical protein UL82_04050 [Corynebacterium kutscheri]|uniref:Uncharacterized protein n=1 Tax=Corynebacterium kutscheri TaxID=35755 RepID=A0A0F6R004_9CORY|nr:hypothetical protein [Corynebacterium kutscheri]AKE41015.1 hypothetical protein UL82_04050 [Corynebacterium kutscheri]VEH09313.1 hypothetical membrane protein [Corynebacterium kutscheri]
MSSINLKKPHDVSTAATTTVGLVGGWLIARETGIRPLGGVVLAAAGAWSARSWYAKGKMPLTLGLTSAYVTVFGLSHPLAKKIGAWPSVFMVTAGVASAAHLLSDSK